MIDSRKRNINLNKYKVLKLGLMAVIAAISFFVVRYIELEDVKEFVLRHKSFSALIYILTFIILPIFFFPVPIIVLAGGTIFGLFYGSLYTMIAVVFNTTIMYFLGRFLFKDFVHDFIRTKMSKKLQTALLSKNQKVLSLVLFIIRLSPIFSYNLVNYISGVTEINFIYYLLTTIVGVLPGVIVFINIGENVLKPGSPEFFLSLSFLLVLVLISAILSKLFLKSEE